AGDSGASGDGAAVPAAETARTRQQLRRRHRAGAGQHLRHLSRAPICVVDSRRPDRSSAHRWRRRIQDLPADCRSVAEADHRDTRGVHVARHMERLHVAADRADRPEPLHVTGRARELVARARRRQRADDGGLRADDAAGARRVPRVAALLRRGLAGGKRESVTMHSVLALCLAMIIWCAPAWAQAPSAYPTRGLDTFEQLAPWQPGASDGVRASIRSVAGPSGSALHLDFDLGGTAGYALAARTLPLDLPANYEIAFDLRADAPVNNFQVKLTDESGENVWWFNRSNFEFPREWQHIAIKKRQVDFAWGPTKDRALKHAARLEFVVAAGSGGGA